MRKSSDNELASIKKEAYVLMREAMDFGMRSLDKDKATEAMQIMHSMATVITQLTSMMS